MSNFILENQFDVPRLVFSLSLLYGPTQGSWSKTVFDTIVALCKMCRSCHKHQCPICHKQESDFISENQFDVPRLVFSLSLLYGPTQGS